MRRAMGFRWIVLVVTVIGLLLGAGLASAAGELKPVAARPAQTAAPKSGRITGATTNVRSQPGTKAAIVGKLRKGDRVQITGQRPGWVEIVYPSGSNQRGWVSAGLVALDGQKASGSTAKPGAVPAPVIVDYQLPNVLWKWDGENTVKGQDWYFDILLMKGGNNQPYDTAQAYPSDVTKKNGVWSFAQPKRLLCDTQMMMAIATVKDGKWAGWISPLSNGITVGGSCGGGGSNPDPEFKCVPICPSCTC